MVNNNAINNILSVIENSPSSVSLQIASRVKARRLDMNLTQEGLALRAGIKAPTYRRFERTGEISLKGLLQVAFALNALQDFDSLFVQQQYQSLDDLLSNQQVNRKRGRRNG